VHAIRVPRTIARRALYLGLAALPLTALASCGSSSKQTTTTAGSSSVPSSTTTAAPDTTIPGNTPTSASTDGSGGATDGSSNASGLPSINAFRDNPSDRLPVDSVLISAGFPFKGKNAVTPHTGAHIIFGTDFESWPQGGTAPSNYPPIYAVADGIVSHVTDTLAVGENDRYGVNLSIAADGTAVIDFEYSIEPMVKEPSPGFYKTFLLVKEGDHVKKGDVIAYMYLPKGSEGAHIHFELINSATHAFMAPAIFSKETVAEFYGTWKNFGFDSNDGPKNPIPPCIGWKLTADENPLENKAVDCLTYPAASGA